MKLKSLLVKFILVTTVITLAACGSETKEDTSGETNDSSSEETYKVNIAYGNKTDEPIDQQANKWKELAEEESDGRLELELYPNSQLGDEGDVVEQAINGNNVVVLTGYDFLMDYVPDLGILTAPYIVDDFEELFYLTKTDWFKGLEEDLDSKGLDIVTTNTIYGERHLMTKEEVLTPEDLAGKKIRVPDNNMYIKSFEALGASPTPLPLADLYTSLQQGVVDGAENPLPVLQGSRTNEVTDYLALTGHTKIISPWVAGTSFMETLPDDIAQILIETGDEAGEYAKSIVDDKTEEVLQDFEEEGITINEVDTESFRKASMDVYENIDSWSPDLYETVTEILEEK